ncbi:MAG: hypothetical protein A3K09_05720 [Nitrospinae bacterium RIFCSPLOWO2_12_FULL_47_7]|nr:MAG: hypothetical protein A3K09_05720 [Nitrospinae bacterium RIFCSPLOWO2_12_FULL_47_7]
MGYFLVIGGTGVMGTAAIQAVRAEFGEEAIIVANWYGKEVPGFKIEKANHTIFGDITDPKCVNEIKAISSGKFDYMFYATALGEVGFPILDTTPEQVAQSNKLSFNPIMALENTFNIGTIVTYSTFYTLKHQQCSYGAMGYSKEAIEKWAVLPGKSKRLCIRAGLFESQSSRGIKLLLRKTAKHIEDIKSPLLRSYFEGVSTSEGIQKFEKGIINEELEVYGDSPTNQESLYQAHLRMFKSDNAVFINVCGGKIWESQEPLLLKDHVTAPV